MVAAAVVAAVLGTINSIIGLFNGLPTAYSLAGKVLPDKGEKDAENKLKNFIDYLNWVRRKVYGEVTRRLDSKCSETSIQDDLKPLEGELERSWSIVGEWNNKNCLRKRLASREYIEKWEKSENTIRHRLEEFLFYTSREETKQHTAVKHKNGNRLLMESGNPAVRENKNENPSAKKSGKVLGPTTKENGEERYNGKYHKIKEFGNSYENPSAKKSGKVLGPTTKENVVERYNGKYHKIKEFGNSYENPSAKKSGKVLGPTTKENVEERYNGKYHKIKEFGNSYENPSAKKSGKVLGPTTKENVEERNNGKSQFEKQEFSNTVMLNGNVVNFIYAPNSNFIPCTPPPMESRKVLRPTTKENVEERNNGKSQFEKQELPNTVILNGNVGNFIYAPNSNLSNLIPCTPPPMESRKVLRPTTKENVEKRNNGESHKIKELGKENDVPMLNRKKKGRKKKGT